MQLIINNSKYLLVLALLSLSFSLALYTSESQVTSIRSAETFDNANDKTIDITNAPDTEAVVIPSKTLSKPIHLAHQTNRIVKPVVTSNTNIWNTMRADFHIDHKTNSPQVKAEIKKLLADKKKLYSILQAARPYIYFIYAQTQVRGLPAELALIPIIESEYNPNDHSTKGATGLWQLMPGTARGLGIKNVHASYDGRRNVIASTNAALSYFSDLGKLFKGDWYLALAAYNAGEVKVMSAERHAGSHSYWNLHLPHETRIYVPKLLAVAAILKDPAKYGIQLPPIINQPYFTALKIKKPVTLVKIAKQSGLDQDQLVKLNPDYRNGVMAVKGAYTLLVPIEKAHLVKSQLAASLIT